MEVRICYSKTCELVCEVDDSFKALTTEGGWDTLSREERLGLSHDLIRVADRIIGNDCSLHYVETLDDEVLVEY
jgi:pyridoxine 5'-phosphate synthase PdxJ